MLIGTVFIRINVRAEKIGETWVRPRLSPEGDNKVQPNSTKIFHLS